MDKKNIIFAAIGFVGGVAAGIISVHIYNRIKDRKTDDNLEPVVLSDLSDEDREKFEPRKRDKKSNADEHAEYNHILEEEGYAAESEYPEDDDPDEEIYQKQLESRRKREEYVKSHEGKIEMMKDDEWDTDFPEDDYGQAELWYFPDEDVLTDEDGNVLDNITDYVGELFEKTRFRTNDWEQIKIRNHPMEMKYYIHKETRMTREEFFY